MEKDLMKELLLNEEPDIRILEQLHILMVLLQVKIPQPTDQACWSSIKGYLHEH
jgi:hypothetical protein